MILERGSYSNLLTLFRDYTHPFAAPGNLKCDISHPPHNVEHWLKIYLRDVWTWLNVSSRGANSARKLVFNASYTVKIELRCLNLDWSWRTKSFSTETQWYKYHWSGLKNLSWSRKSWTKYFSMFRSQNLCSCHSLPILLLYM